MKICMVSKFPPIEGGIASRTYWLAKGLAEAGHEIAVVTNSASVEKDYKICNCDDHLRSLKNIKVNSISDSTPWHIPNSHQYATRLLNNTLKLLNSEHFDLIDSGFLVPYGIVAYLAHKITSIPYIIRHGGSDIAKFVDHPEYSNIIAETIRHASAIITDEKHVDLFSPLNRNISILPSYIPDERIFAPATKISASPTFAYIGKVNYFWRRKGLDKIVDIFDRLNSDIYRLLFVAQGLGLEDFKNSLSKNMHERIVFQQFVPPWEMPSLLATIDYIFSFAVDETIENPSNLVNEALASGVEAITNHDLNMPAPNGIHKLQLDDSASCVSYVRGLISGYSSSYANNIAKERFTEPDYISHTHQNIKIYESLLKA